MTATVAPPAAPAPPPGLDPLTTTGAFPVSASRASHGPAPEGRALFVDVAGTLILTGLALGGLCGVFGGAAPLLIGLVGAVAAIATLLLVERFKLRGFATLALLLVAFVLAGGVAVSADAIAGFLPGPGTPAALLDGLISSWKDLVTTAPPVGTDGGIGVVPYVIGWASAGLGFAFARRTRSPLLPVLPPVLGVIASIVLGERDPWSIAVQGGLFAAIALGWGALRANRTRRALSGEINWGRFAGAMAMLVIVATVSVVAVDHDLVPGVNTADRRVARDEVVPPFDPRDYPSPLGGFRNYSIGAQEKEVLFVVNGLPKGARIRLSAMDQYDDVVWVVGGPESESGRFRRVGEEILPVPPGDSANLEVQVEDYSGVWIPSTGTIRQVEFGGPRADELATAFRYNSDTGVAATPVALKSGDRFTVDVRLPAESDELESAAVDPTASVGSPPVLSDKAKKAITAAVSGASSPYAQAKALEKYFSEEGFFSEGRKDDVGAAFSAPGHSLARLDKPFLASDAMVGDAEQYAAAMALAARSLGLPARVVFGFAPEVAGTSTEVTGADVDAWVEIKFEGAGWMPFDPTPDEDRTPQEKPKPKPKQEELAQQPPQNEQRLDAPDDAEDLSKKTPPPTPPPPKRGFGFSLPTPVKYALVAIGIPTLIFGAYAAVVLLIKRVRRNRRRDRGTLVARASGAWSEAVDQARDRGARWPRHLTRTEVASSVSSDTWASAPAFAASVDNVMFGPAGPTPEIVDDLWQRADAERTSMLEGLSRSDRWKARLSTRSLRPI